MTALFISIMKQCTKLFKWVSLNSNHEKIITKDTGKCMSKHTSCPNTVSKFEWCDAIWCWDYKCIPMGCEHSRS